MELMVAVFIFSIAAVCLMQGLQAGDRIRGKAYVSRNAARAAGNEAERIRAAAMTGVRLQDTTYTDTIAGGKYQVTRENIVPEDGNARLGASQEIVISVEPQGGLYQPYVFKVIQGYHQ